MAYGRGSAQAGGDRGARGGRGGSSNNRGGNQRGLAALQQGTMQRNQAANNNHNNNRGGPSQRGGGRGRGARGNNRNSSSNSSSSNNSISSSNSYGQANTMNTAGSSSNSNPTGAATNPTNSTTLQQNATGTPRNPMNSTPLPQNAYSDRLTYLLDDRPRVKAQLIRDRKMNPDGRVHLSAAIDPAGLCTDMCPELERVRRIVQNDVKAPECTPETAHGRRQNRIPDEKRMVKAYKRPSPGDDTDFPSEIRTPDTLLKTMNYMAKRLDHEEIEFLYGWLWDRVRAVARDFTLQFRSIRSPRSIATYIACHEQSIRMHLIFVHHMALSTSVEYSAQQDMEQIGKTFTTLKARYDMNGPSPNEAEMRAYEFLLDLDVPGRSIDSFPEHLRLNGRVQTAWDIYKAAYLAGSAQANIKQAQQNWAQFWALIQSSRVSYLMACAAGVHFNAIRYRVLVTLWHAYRQGHGKRTIRAEDWTLDKLLGPLGLDDGQSVKEFCMLYGFQFGVNSEGAEFLDTTSVPYFSGATLRGPPKVRKFPSRRIVDCKRYGRSFSAIVQGMSVREARTHGLLVEKKLNVRTEKETHPDDEDSLFIPEESTTIPAGPASGNGLPGTTPTGPKLSPFASLFQPAAPGPTAPHPFQHVTPAASHLSPFATPPPSSPGQNGTIRGPAFPGATPATVRPGLFDASKNVIQFAPPTVVTNTFATAKTDNPFAKATPETTASAFANTPTTTPVPAAPNPFAKARDTSTLGQKPSPFSSFTQSPSVFAPSSSPSTQSAGPSIFASSTPKSEPVGPSMFAPSSTPTFQAASQQAFSPTQDKQHRHAEEEQRKALEQQQQRKAEEQRKAAEEQQRKVRAEQQRQAEERQRLAREEQEHQAREQQRQLQLEQERQRQLMIKREAERREREERDRALNNMAEQLLTEPGGLMSQFLEHITAGMAKSIAAKLQEEKMEQLAESMYQKKRLAFMRAVCVRWVMQVQKKKRKAQARKRRERLRANVAQIEAPPAESVEGAPRSVAAPTLLQANGVSNGFKTPEAPASVARQKKLPKPQKKKIEKVATKAKAVKKPDEQKDITRASVSANSVSTATATTNGDYSKAYYNSKAPIDRTETDWFKLRAMGIDPSKHRKRSFGSVSSDDEDESTVELKRARRSTSSTYRSSLPPPTTDEERIARFRAVQRALNQGSAAPSVNGHIPQVIAHARETLTFTPTSKNSPPNVQHEFSRSVPDLGLRKSAPRLSMFGKSIGAPLPGEKPAYWSRTSRFVPQHLYGKGPEAVRAYRNQYYGRSPASSEPLELSSPIPTQQSYIPSGATQSYHEQHGQAVQQETYEGHGFNEYGGEGEPELYSEDESAAQPYGDELIDYGDEEQESLELYDRDGDSEMSDEGYQQYAQKPGGTQDDAIELSD